MKLGIGPTSRFPFAVAMFIALVVTLEVAAPYAEAADVVLYEVTETMTVKGGRIARRLATAGLSGTAKAGTALCPEKVATTFNLDRCSVTAFAYDNLDLRTGRGPVTGKFAVVVQDLNTIDGPEVVILRGTFAGDVDLSPAIMGRDGVSLTGDEVPLGYLTGTYTAQGVAGGPLAGTTVRGSMVGPFRLPFTSMLDGQTPAYLISASPWTEEPVGAGGRIFGTPMVRLELHLTP